MSLTTPDLPFGAQLIGRTEKSLDALLTGVLTGSGLSEPEYVALRVCADRAGTRRADVTAELATAFRQGEHHAAALIERLSRAGMISSDQTAPVQLTPAGRKLHDRLVAETDAIAGRLWGDLPTDDLAAAARVLSTVLRRAATERA
jgi:DNA-binding MarR family transcriptional regulator